MAARMPRMTSTSSSSIRVKACLNGRAPNDLWFDFHEYRYATFDPAPAESRIRVSDVI